MVVPPKHPKIIIFSWKTLVVGYHHFRKPPYEELITLPETNITNSSHLQMGRAPKGKDHLPTIDFSGAMLVSGRVTIGFPLGLIQISEGGTFAGG